MRERRYIKVPPTFPKDSSKQKPLHYFLHTFYNNYIGSPESYDERIDSLENLRKVRFIEDAWNLYEENRIKNYSLPTSSTNFSEWYYNIKQLHKNKEASLFDFLAEDASLEQLAYYIFCESKVDGRFDDLISLAQIGIDGYGKIIMAENYWDEMGKGKLDKMHTVLFNTSVSYMMKILNNKSLLNKENVLPSLKNSNLLFMYALRRKFSLRLLGTIGILEDTAGERFIRIVKGLKRTKVPQEAIAYHEEHIHVDHNHGVEWKQHVLDPLIKKENKHLIKEISKGILIRYNIAIDYYQSIFEKIKTFHV